jgi:hypothetical protein
MKRKDRILVDRQIHFPRIPEWLEFTGPRPEGFWKCIKELYKISDVKGNGALLLFEKKRGNSCDC